MVGKQMHSEGSDSSEIRADHMTWSRPADVRVERAQAELCPDFAGCTAAGGLRMPWVVGTVRARTMV